jgi:LysR family transcriptional regulator, nitrogen assimilation regulatory protein
MDRVYEELGQVDGHLAGRVSVGMPPTWARLIVRPFAQLLQRAVPHSSLTLTEALSANLREEVLQGRLDIALLYDAAPAPELELVTLKKEEVVVVSRADDPGAIANEPLMLQQLAAMPLIMPCRPNVVRMFLEREACAAGLRPNIAYDIDGLASILDLVREGTGHALLPQSSVQDPGGAFRTRRVGPAGLWMPLMLAVSSRRPVTQTQRAALEILADLARTTTAQGPACKA